jgi:DNA-directed RNA polymerase specialized sigma24 family protein
MNATTASEAELLAVMATQDVRREEARAAWEELYVRHRRYLYVVAARAYRGFLGEDGIVDLVVDTFRRAYEWAGRQGSPDQVRAQFTGSDAESTRRRVLGWLGAIAQQLFRDRFREHASEAAAFSGFLEDQVRGREHPADDSEELPASRLESALAMLNTADADALRVSLPWYDVDSRSFAMPRGEAARVAVLLGVSVDALRKRRHRAIKKLEQYIEGAESAENRGGVAR